MAKKIFKWLGILLAVIVVLLLLLIGFLSITEFKPADRDSSENVYYTLKDGATAEPAKINEPITITSWNIGYCGLGKDSDFFMDGGKMVNPPSDEHVEENLEGIQKFIKEKDSDLYILQEVDVNSSRTNKINEYDAIAQKIYGNSAFTYNYKCPFVPIPIPPMGKVESGIATFSTFAVGHHATRVSLPCPFEWPMRVAQLKRCILVNRVPLQKSEKELIIVNLHLEAYDDGEGKIAQTKVLMEVLEEEYAKGNYVIAGGDFNQAFPNSLEKYPIKDSEKWTPGTLENDILPEGWSFAYDINNPTCRLLDAPYSGENQHYIIDGFIVSPNVKVNSVECDNLKFENSDHNPVTLEFICEK